MSKRKKRKSRRTNKTATNKLSPQQLKLQAQQALSNHHYKIAIQHLKVLLKSAGKSDEILALLQKAYTGRAEELAEGGMLKEAVSIWDVAIQYGLDPVDPRYLDWIVAAQQYYRLGKIYQQLDAKDQRCLQPQLAATCLSGNTSILNALAEEDPVKSGYQAAHDLLQAWCSGEDDKRLQHHMKAISFRSPYRDLRQIIQAWLILEKTPEQAGKAIERITKTSPFYPLAQQLQLAALDTPEFIEQLASLSLTSKNCALAIRGWNDKQTVTLLKKLQQLGAKPSAKKLSNTLLGLSKQLTKDKLTATTKYWLNQTTKKVCVISEDHHYNDLNLNKSSVSPRNSNALEQYHYEWLSAIANKMPPPFISRKIELYLEELKSTPDNEIKKADKLLISSLLNRYLVDEWKAYEEDKLTDKSLVFLEQLLLDDPSDDKSWIELLEYQLQQEKLKPARDALKDALAHHPENIKILDLAVRIAIKGNAFVKAAGYAKRILAVDPINTSAQLHLQYAHLSHASKQFKQKKWHLVHKELDQARQWKGTALTETLIEVLQAYQIQAEKDIQVAASAFQALSKTSTVDNVALDFIIRYQGLQINYVYVAALKNAKLATLWNKPDKDKVFALIDIVQQLMKNNPESIAKPLESLSKPLKKAAKLPFTATEGERVCEFLMQIGDEVLLNEYSLKLRQKHKNHPIFNYYLFVNHKHLNYKEMGQLEDAWEIAKEQSDDATSSRIAGLLHRLSNPFANPFSGGHPFFDEDEDDDWDMFDEMPNIEEMDAAMSAVETMIELGDGADEQEKANIIANILPIMPPKELLNVAEGMVGRKNAQLILNELNVTGLRTFCQRCLKGEEPDDVMNDMGIASAKPAFLNSIFGDLF